MDNDDWRVISPREFHSIDQIFECIPADISNLKFLCVNGHEFAPDWLKKRHPIRNERLKNNLIARPIGASEKCHVCEGEVKIDLPAVDHLGDRKLYGDEAFRSSAGKRIITYSLVAGSPDRAQVEKEFLQAKFRLCPSTDPTSWKLHCTNLMNARNREKSPIFANVSREHIQTFMKDVGLLLQRHKKTMPIWNCTGVFVAPNGLDYKDEQNCMARIYSWLFIIAVRESTGGGISPTFYFDKTNKDGWAKNLYRGVSHTLMWPFVTNCIHVPAPRFVNPRNTIYLEIADLVSFVVARYLFIVSERHAGNDQEFDVDPGWFGEVRYSGFQVNGTGILKKQVGYPMMEFFAGTGWENHTN